jgi:hypothetical protein
VTAGSFALTDASALTISGPVTASNNVTLTDSASGTAITTNGKITAGGTIALAAGSGVAVSGGPASLPAIQLGGTSNLSSATLVLNSRNTGLTTAVGEVSGALLNVTHLTGATSAGNVVLTSSGNSIGTLDAFIVTKGNLSFTNGQALQIASANTAGAASAARVQADNITLVSKAVTITGDVVTAGTFSFTVNGAIQRTAGNFVIGSLTGSASTLADFGTASAITTLGSITVTGGQLAIDNANPLTVAGPLSAEFFHITAASQITLSADIFTLGMTRAEQGLSGNLASINPTVLASSLPATGSYFLVADVGAGATFEQTGTVNLTPLNGALATLRIQLPLSGGSIVLNNLNAPAADLILVTQGGTARGTINVADFVLVGKSGASDFNGVVAGLTGAAAATKAQIGPQPDAKYRFNSCPIGSVNCVLSPVGAVPPTNPLRYFFIGPARDMQDDSDLILPNVSDEDY